MSEDLRTWMKSVLKELQKHANRDGCYNCKQLLKPKFLQPFLETLKETT